MRRFATALLVLSLPLLLLALVWQTGRYAGLKSELALLERRQREWIEENRKLLASVSVLSSRERVEARALMLGLDKARPAERIFIETRPRAAAEEAAP